MRKTQIVLTVDDSLSDSERQALRWLLSDALYEFRRGARRNPESYVNSHYAHLSDKDKERKIEDVQARIDLAERLHSAALTHEVREIEVPEDEA